MPNSGWCAKVRRRAEGVAGGSVTNAASDSQAAPVDQRAYQSGKRVTTNRFLRVADSINEISGRVS